MLSIISAHNRSWTGDLFLTKEVLYHLSYVGECTHTIEWSGRWGSNPHHQLGRLRFYHWTTPAWHVPCHQKPLTQQNRRFREPLFRFNSSPATPVKNPLNGGGGRIWTSEGWAVRFTVWSLWPLGNPTYLFWSRYPESNGGHSHYKWDALPTELYRPI